MVKAVGLWKVLVWVVPLLARQWPKLVEARAGANFVGDHDREHAASRLREQYARGYLTFDELTRRIGRVVSARSRRDLSRALSGLAPERTAVRPVSQPALRTAILVFSIGAYLVFTFTLLLLLGLVALVQGTSGAELVVFLLVWLVPTYLVVRLWRRKPHF
jgi:Domain of unknown function (DUF1707)